MATATAKKAKALTLGQAVTYINGEGHAKAAFISGLPETVKPGTALPVPSEGSAHLFVLGFRHSYTALSIPSEAVVAQAKEQGNTDFEGGGYFTV